MRSEFCYGIHLGCIAMPNTVPASQSTLDHPLASTGKVLKREDFCRLACPQSLWCVGGLAGWLAGWLASWYGRKRVKDVTRNLNVGSRPQSHSKSSRTILEPRTPLGLLLFHPFSYHTCIEALANHWYTKHYIALLIANPNFSLHNYNMDVRRRHQ